MCQENAWKEIEETAGQDVVSALKRLASLYDGEKLIRWVGGLYDCEHGGFYYSNSARDNEPYRPDIESTNFALSLIFNRGALTNRNTQLPLKMQRAIVDFARNMQSERDGYFYHSQWPQDKSLLAVDRYGRDLATAATLIPSFWLDFDGTGVKRQVRPKYCIPGSSVKCDKHFGTDERCIFKDDSAPKNDKNENLQIQHPDYSSREAFTKWLLDYNKGIKENSGQAHRIAELRLEIIKHGYMDIVLDHLDLMLEEIYNEQLAAGEKPTGVWQKTADYKAVWGLFKYLCLYNMSDHGRKIDIKYVPYMVDTCIEVLKMKPDGTTFYMNDIMNQGAAISRIVSNVRKHYGEEYVPAIYERVRAHAAEIIDNTIEKIKPFMIDDGSFSYKPDGRSLKIIYGSPISLGEVEGDLNAAILAVNAYSTMFEIIGYKTVPIFTSEDGELFIKIVSEEKRIVKKPEGTQNA